MTIFRRATAADAATTLSWSPDAVTLRRWVGPSARWPATAESLWADINTPDFTTFALEDPAHGLVGFGQLKHRDGTIAHLARVIVSPHHRGQGYGRMLCTALMHEAPRLYPIVAYSLYVYRDNAAAMKLYRSLGFVVKVAHPKFPEIVLMEAPAESPR